MMIPIPIKITRRLCVSGDSNNNDDDNDDVLSFCGPVHTVWCDSVDSGARAKSKIMVSWLL